MGPEPKSSLRGDAIGRARMNCAEGGMGTKPGIGTGEGKEAQLRTVQVGKRLQILQQQRGGYGAIEKIVFEQQQDKIGIDPIKAGTEALAPFRLSGGDDGDAFV